MNACFICGCDWVCGHREAELVRHEYTLRRALALLNEAEAARTSLISRKPPANAPSASNGKMQVVKER